jgi:hypothetical protein
MQASHAADRHGAARLEQRGGEEEEELRHCHHGGGGGGGGGRLGGGRRDDAALPRALVAVRQFWWIGREGCNGNNGQQTSDK